MSEVTEAAGREASSSRKSIYLVSYPKIVFLWPSFLVAVIAAVYMHVTTGSASLAPEESAGAVAIGWTFLLVLAVNLVVLSFDFPRTTSLTLFFVAVAIGLGVALTVVYIPDFLPRLGEMLSSIDPVANATFYYVFAIVMGIIYIGVAVNTKFDYWEVRPNELLHHHGMLSNLERYSAPHLRISKEINDIFEYLLLGSGRLILYPSNEKRAIVLENVMWISEKERQITQLLGALQVQVRESENG